MKEFCDLPEKKKCRNSEQTATNMEMFKTWFLICLADSLLLLNCTKTTQKTFPEVLSVCSPFCRNARVFGEFVRLAGYFPGELQTFVLQFSMLFKNALPKFFLGNVQGIAKKQILIIYENFLSLKTGTFLATPNKLQVKVKNSRDKR